MQQSTGETGVPVQNEVPVKRGRGRGPVVHLDRSHKAMMIEAILADFRKAPLSDLTTLDIGCGNGGISDYFAQSNEHYAVDIIDQRRAESRGYEFAQVDSEQLPFEDKKFDVVLSHHVIEHVSDQSRHLSEIHRVLKDDGIAYIATPNKSSPIMEGHVGNDMVLRYREMTPLFEANGFRSHEYGLEVVNEPEQFFCEVRYGRYLPKWALKLMRSLYPSHMFVLTKS